MSDSRVRPFSERALEAEARVQQLENALREIRKLAESFESYHLDMGRKPDPWMHQIRNITGAALFSEGPEKES